MSLPAATLALDIGFLPVSIWDLVDVALVSYLFFRIARLVRGSIASNIFIGIVTLYVLYFVVGQLGMQMLRAILAQFVAVGVIVVIVIFQPEIRRSSWSSATLPSSGARNWSGGCSVLAKAVRA